MGAPLCSWGLQTGVETSTPFSPDAGASPAHCSSSCLGEGHRSELGACEGQNGAPSVAVRLFLLGEGSSGRQRLPGGGWGPGLHSGGPRGSVCVWLMLRPLAAARTQECRGRVEAGCPWDSSGRLRRGQPVDVLFLQQKWPSTQLSGPPFAVLGVPQLRAVRRWCWNPQMGSGSVASSN